MEGEATATYLIRLFKSFPGLSVTRLASGSAGRRRSRVRRRGHARAGRSPVAPRSAEPHLASRRPRSAAVTAADPVSAVLSAARAALGAAPPRLGAVRAVAVDGPSGSGQDHGGRSAGRRTRWRRGIGSASSAPITSPPGTTRSAGGRGSRTRCSGRSPPGGPPATWRWTGPAGRRCRGGRSPCRRWTCWSWRGCRRAGGRSPRGCPLTVWVEHPDRCGPPRSRRRQGRRGCPRAVATVAGRGGRLVPRRRHPRPGRSPMGRGRRPGQDSGSEPRLSRLASYIASSAARHAPGKPATTV